MSRIDTVEMSSEAVDRPADFDLVRAWDDVTRDMPNWPTVTVTLEVQPDAVAALQATYGPNLTVIRQEEPQHVTVPFATVDIAVSDLLQLGNLVRVLDPPAVQAALARIGTDFVNTYGQLQ